MKLPNMEEMLKAGVHFGHQASRWHPSMKKFIFGKRNGIHIIDLEKTQSQLETATDFISGVVSRGGKILFLGTKPQTKSYVEEAAGKCGMPYVTDRWLGGTLTNFAEISKLIKRLLDLKRKNQSGDLKKYTKREQLQFRREIEELEGKVGGISTLTRTPEAIVVFDVRNDLTAVKEANRKGIPVVAMCDTNINVNRVQYPVPANDDAVKSIELMAEAFSKAVLEGASKRKTTPKAAVKKVAIK